MLRQLDASQLAPDHVERPLRGPEPDLGPVTDESAAVGRRPVTIIDR
jgi:hypothetical protein